MHEDADVAERGPTTDLTIEKAEGWLRALSRISFGIFLVVVGIGVSYVLPPFFAIVGIFVIGRAIWRWVDRQKWK